MNVKILITGGSGFIGTTAVDHYLNKGIELVNIDINPPYKKEHLPYWHKNDILNSGELCKEFRNFQPTHVLHLAATLGQHVSDMNYFAANTDGVANVIKAAKEVGKGIRVLFTSSLLVCRNGYIPMHETDYCPPNLYGESKMIGEKLVRDCTDDTIDWNIVRPTSVWGPFFRYSYRQFFKAISKGMYFHLGNTRIVKPASFVGNTVYMMDKVLFSERAEISRQTYYLADYPYISTREWAEAIRAGLRIKKIRTVPVGVLRFGAYAGDVLMFLGYKEPPLSSFRLNNMLTGGIYPVDNTKELAGELPYNLEQGVERTIAWMREVGDIN